VLGGWLTEQPGGWREQVAEHAVTFSRRSLFTTKSVVGKVKLTIGDRERKPEACLSRPPPSHVVRGRCVSPPGSTHPASRGLDVYRTLALRWRQVVWRRPRLAPLAHQHFAQPPGPSPNGWKSCRAPCSRSTHSMRVIC
jgi:hypothetical protein